MVCGSVVGEVAEGSVLIETRGPFAGYVRGCEYYCRCREGFETHQTAISG